MKNKLLSLISFAILVIFSGCMQTTMKEERQVSPVILEKKAVIFKAPMVWANKPVGKTRAIRFPKGIYTIEAEDAEYYYFMAPEDIEYKIFKEGKVVDSRKIPGGLFYKKIFHIIPAGAYMSVSSKTKTLTWKLGKNFLEMEGNEWKKNF